MILGSGDPREDPLGRAALEKAGGTREELRKVCTSPSAREALVRW